MMTGNNLYTAQKSLSIGILLYGATFLAKQYEERFNTITSILSILDQGLQLIAWVALLGFVSLRLTSQNPNLARKLAFMLVVMHPFIHYVGEKGTLLDSYLHLSFVVLGVHNSYLRSKHLLLGVAFAATTVAWNFRQQATYFSGDMTAWGIYMMGMPLTTFQLTIDGVAAPMAAVVDFAFSNESDYFLFEHRGDATKKTTDSGGDHLAEAGVCVAWVISFVGSLGYMAAVDGPTYGWMAAYLTGLEFVTCLFVLLVTPIFPVHAVERLWLSANKKQGVGSF